MIERYESRRAPAWEELDEAAYEEDDIDSLAERLTCIPQITDPDIYRVRVHVGLFHDVP